MRRGCVGGRGYRLRPRGCPHLAIKTRSSGRLPGEKGAAMSLVNHQFRLAARPVGMPKRSDWNYTEEPVREPADGEVVVKVLYVSLDPAMRGWMNDAGSYIK